MKRVGRKGTIFIVIGAVLVLAALSLFAYNKWQGDKAQKAAEDVREQMEEVGEDQESQDRIVPEDGIMPTVTIDGYEYIGTLTIPRFGLELPVMSEWSYPGLRIAPGRFSGSVWTDDLIIAGHNYERHFGNLKNMDAGDDVSFTDVLGNVFDYEVMEVDTLEPTAVEEMKAGEWDLTLFTCTYGGQARVTVRCMRTDKEN